MKVLCIGPHVDDVELMVGGSIVKWIEEGHDVYYLALSSAKSSNVGFDTVRECSNSLAVLNVKYENIIMTFFEVRRFCEKRQEILDVLISLKNSINPDLAIFPDIADKHQDHRVVAEESLRAFSDCNAISYKQPWNCQKIEGDFFVSLSEDHLRKKKLAIAEYQSQTKRQYTDWKYIEATARFFGLICGEEFAEVFKVVKWKWGIN